MVPSCISPSSTPVRPSSTNYKAMVLLVAALALSPLGLAESSLASQAVTQSGPIPTPEQPGAIPLREPLATADPEHWEIHGGSRSIRNVINPTLTPVLPDPAKATGAAVIVAPGGGFMALSIDSEGYQVAQWLADRGIAAFVLKYRLEETPSDPAKFGEAMQKKTMGAILAGVGEANPKPLEPTADAVEDAEAAVRLVRKRAKEWGIDPKRIGFVGFSAGAMTAMGVGLTEDKAARPDFIAPIYPPMMARPVAEYAPPMFLAIALDDPLFAKNQQLGLIEAWRQAGRPLEVHLYERGGHGFGIKGNSSASAQWIDQFHGWMEDRGITGPNSELAGKGQSGFSVVVNTIGQLLENPETKAVLEQHIPQLVTSDRIDMMSGSTLVQMQSYAAQLLTSEKLKAIQADLDKL